MQATHELMSRAISLGAGSHPHPNPRVGAVVVDAGGSIVGCGHHTRAGEDHAEVVALAEAGTAAAGGTLVVTLEPCDHEGRTPPCTAAIVDAAVARVVVGAIDPDRRVAGRGIAALRALGVEVEGPIAQQAVEAADPAYFHHRRTSRPLVTLKWAMTVDGQVAAADGTSQWITSEDAREDAHSLRAESDAVLVGIGTVLADDPRLTVRVDGFTGTQPTPVVIGGKRDLPSTASIAARDPLVYSPTNAVGPGEVVALPGDAGVDLAAVIEDLGKRGFVAVLVEGGPTISGAMLASGLVDRVVIYVGALVAGGLGMAPASGVFATIAEATTVEITGVRPVGRDLRIDIDMGSGG